MSSTTTADAGRVPIRVGDKFLHNGAVLEVIRTLPGGKIELFNRDKAIFHFRYTREMRDWTRAALAAAKGAGQ